MRLVALAAAAALMAPGAAPEWPKTSFNPHHPEASGYHVVFSDDFSSQATLDAADTRAPGFKWYVHPFLGGHQKPEAVIRIEDGHLTLANGGNVATAAPAPGAQGWVGQTFAHGGYFETTLSLGPTPAKAKGWPSFWSMSLEHLIGDHGDKDPIGSGKDVRYGEDDFYERDTDWAGLDTYGAALHEFYGTYQSSCHPNSYCEHSNNGEGTPYNNYIIHTGSRIDWAARHTISQVWSPATPGHPGYIRNYFDGKPVGPNPTIWSRDPHDPFSVLDRQHLVIILGTGSEPMSVHSVRVWAK